MTKVLAAIAASVALVMLSATAFADKGCPKGTKYNPETKKCEKKSGKRGSY